MPMSICDGISTGLGFSLYMLFTMGDQLVHTGNDRLFLIDSHSRNSKCLIDPNGSAVLMEFLRIESVANICWRRLTIISDILPYILIVCPAIV